MVQGALSSIHPNNTPTHTLGREPRGRVVYTPNNSYGSIHPPPTIKPSPTPLSCLSQRTIGRLSFG